MIRSLHNRGRYRIVISGSNARLLLPDIATELRGRYRDHLILPFSFKEMLRWSGISWTERTFYTAAKGDLLRIFDTFLKTGGFPEVLKKDSPGRDDSCSKTTIRPSFIAISSNVTTSGPNP